MCWRILLRLAAHLPEWGEKGLLTTSDPHHYFGEGKAFFFPKQIKKNFSLRH